MCSTVRFLPAPNVAPRRSSCPAPEGPMAYEEAEEEGEEEVWSEMRSSHWLYGTDTKGTMVLLLAVSAYFNMLQAPSVLDLRHLHRHNAHEGLGTASTTGLGPHTAGACRYTCGQRSCSTYISTKILM